MSINLRELAGRMADADKIITPQYDKYMLEHGDDPFPEWVAERIKQEIMRKPRFRPGTFSASSAGSCPRAQVLGFLGLGQDYLHDPQLQSIFNDGKWRHLRWQATLLAAGALVDIEWALPWPNMNAWATADGVGEVPMDHPRVEWRGKEFGFELKGVSTFQFAKHVKDDKPIPKHVEQIRRGMLISGTPLWVLLYEDKTTQRTHEWVIERDPVHDKRHRAQLTELNASVTNRKLFPLLDDCKKRKGTGWSECPFGKDTMICPKAGDWPRLGRGNGSKKSS